MKQKIIVAIPQNIIPKGEFGRWDISYGPLIVTQSLRNNGFDAILYDFGVAENEKSGITKNKIPHSGTSDKEIEKIITKEDPSVIAISCNFTYLWNNTKHLINLIKNTNQDIKIILGGNHAEAYKEILKLPISKNISAIIRGTNPQTLIELLKNKKLDNSLETIVTKKERFNKNKMDEYDYNLIDFSKYGKLNHATIPVNGKHSHYLFSLGCDNACEYCQVSYMHGKLMNFKEEKIKKDLENLKDKGVKELVIYDDNFIKLPNELIEKYLKLSSRLFESIHLDGGIEVSKLDSKKIKLLHSRNIKSLYLAVETIDISSMKKLRKFNKKDDYMNHIFKITQSLKKEEIMFYTNSMCAFPNYTKKDLKREIEFQTWLKEKCNADWVTFSSLKLFPGTPNYSKYYSQISKDRKWEINSEYYILCGGPALFDGKDIDGIEAGEILRNAYNKINGQGLPMNPNPYWISNHKRV